MNRYNLWRFFGSLPEPPEEAYTGDPDQALLSLRGRSAPISSLFAIALRFSRLDELKDMLDSDDWDKSGDGQLCRSRLRFYRAMAENPESPEIGLLDDAAADFRRALDHSTSSLEAEAGLARIHALVEGTGAALKHLRRLERKGGRSGRQASSGVYLFIAELPGTRAADRKKFLRRALRCLGRAGKGGGSRLIQLLIKDQLVNVGKTRSDWSTLAGNGSLEARIYLIQSEIDHWKQSVPENIKERLMHDLGTYKKARPSDPRAFVAEGDLLLPDDAESARMAWRSALVLDDRHAKAWQRLGDHYKEAWDLGDDDYRGTWLEAAGDAYLKAVTLEPLNPDYRLTLGIVERESGRPARAIGTLLGGLALTSDDHSIRRWLAVSWTDLSYSPELSQSARSAAAGRAGREWLRLLETGDRHPYDLMGLLRSMAVEAAEEQEKSKELKPDIPALTGELIKIYPRDNAADLIGLANDYIRAGFIESARELLDCVSESQSDNPALLAAGGAILESSDSKESMRMYLAAASKVNSGTPERIRWLASAADMAAVEGKPEDSESIIRSGLKDQPGNPRLLKKLSEILQSDDRADEVSELYRNALQNSPEDRDLLEDAVWFTREVGMSGKAESFLRDALKLDPEDSRLWNQLGVHFMESGWNEPMTLIENEALDEAIAAYRRAVELSSDDAVFLGNLGDALRQAGKWTEAAELLAKAVENGSDTIEDAFAVNALARLEDERSYAVEGSDSSAEDWQKSGDHYHRAAVISAANADFQRDYAWWLYRERRLEEAIAFYRRGASLDPSDDSLPYGESICWLELGNEQAALTALEKALEIKPADIVMIADKADILGATGNADLAERLYRDVITRSEDAAWTWERLAEFREHRALEAEPAKLIPELSLAGPGHFDAESLVADSPSPAGESWRRLALTAWEKALKIDPDNRKLRARCGAAWMELGNREKSLELLSSSTLLTGEPWTSDCLNRLGRLEILEALSTGSPEMWNLSKNHLTAAAEISPMEASFQAATGYWNYLKGDWLKALEAFRQAADRAPGAPEYAANSGICAYATGSFDEAAAYLRRALTLRDSEAEWQNTLGLSLLASGNPGEALNAFRSACLIDPRSELYPANLAMAHHSLHAPEGLLQ